MSGTDDVKTVEDNIKDIRAKFPKHDVFTITSRNGAQINGDEVKRKQFMQDLKSCENALIFHFDILSEGIDVDGITGVAIMRNMGLSKLLQTIGRAIRLYKPDPSKKPQAWISVPVINGNEDDKERIAFILRTLRNGGFDISKEDIYETKSSRHQTEDEEMGDAFDKYKNNFSSLFVEEVLHEIENDEFWIKLHTAQTVNDKLDLLFGEEA